MGEKGEQMEVPVDNDAVGAFVCCWIAAPNVGRDGFIVEAAAGAATAEFPNVSVLVAPNNGADVVVGWVPNDSGALVAPVAGAPNPRFALDVGAEPEMTFELDLRLIYMSLNKNSHQNLAMLYLQRRNLEPV